MSLSAAQIRIARHRRTRWSAARRCGHTLSSNFVQLRRFQGMFRRANRRN
jgi:hypothetical protein